MPSFYKILLGTPIWGWAIFIYLIFVGTQALKKRSASLHRLAIMPTVLTFFSSEVSLYRNTGLQLLIWFVAWSAGIAIGFALIQRLRVSIDKETGLIMVPGSIVPLVLSLVFFVVKYAFGISYALNPILKSDGMITGCDMALSGIIAGISVGRFFKIRRIYTSVTSL